jgi:eukaryotic-like serine/threonine-protein kinase
MDESILSTVIDGYLIEDRIKAGGVAVVYRAIRQASGDVAAFKLLQAGWIEHEEVVIRFKREAEIMKQLRHPHIVHFFDYGIHKGRPYIAMEYLPGGSLSERLKKYSRITLGGSARLLEQMASALDYAHGKGIVHRDLKPGNILLRDGRHAALTDFGIARLMEHTMLTTVGHMPGTPHYMSPEQARGAEELSYRSDQYSLAVIAYLLSTGRLPFTGFDPLVIINQHLTATVPPPSTINPDLPRDLDDVLLKALDKDPDKRYASVSAFAEAYSDAILRESRMLVTLSTARTDDDQPPLALDADSRVFSSQGFAADAEMTSSPLVMKSVRELRSRRRTVGCFLTVISIMVPLLLTIAGVLALLGVFEGGDSPPATSAAVVEMTDEPTGTHTSTPAMTDTHTPTATATEAPTLTETDQPSRTPTETPSITPTPSATYTPSRTPTPTPIYRDFNDFVTGLNDQLGTTSSFNCKALVEGYDFLLDQLDGEDMAYEAARSLVDDPESPLMALYEDYCQENPDDTGVFISGPLPTELKTLLSELQR